MELRRYLLRGKAVFDTEAGGLAGGGIDTLLIDGETIARVGRWEALHGELPELPAEEYPDGFLFPALVNTHAHLEFDSTPDARVNWMAESPERRFLHAAERANAMLRSGVATVRDAGSSWGLLELRGEEDGVMPLPRMRFAGMPITVTGGHLAFLGEETDGLEAMVRATRLRQKRGCNAIKLVVTGGQMTPGSLPERVSMTTREIAAIAEESRVLGLPTFAHCLTTEGFARCMDGGVDCIEHVACFVRNRENHLLERVWVPEVMDRYAGEGRFFMMGLACHYHNLDDFRSGKRPCGPNEAFWLEQEERMFQIFKRCVAMGLRPVCGTDAGTNGTRFEETWLELALMVERGGLSSAEAIRVCTAQSAECLGLKAGCLAEGHSADVLVLAENPLDTIRAYGAPRHVFAQGRKIL